MIKDLGILIRQKEVFLIIQKQNGNSAIASKWKKARKIKNTYGFEVDRLSRILSYFFLIISQCTTKTQLTGVCMTKEECDTTGTASGNCAAGFGVCCKIT